MLAVAVNADTEISCLQQDPDFLGNPDVGVTTTDLDYLSANEDTTFQYRLAKVVMCANSRNQLIGVRAHVAMVSSSPPPNDAVVELVDQVGMNKFGVMGGNGVSCKTFQLDYLGGEFLSKIEAAWGQFAIRQLVLTSSQG